MADTTDDEIAESLFGDKEKITTKKEDIDIGKFKDPGDKRAEVESVSASPYFKPQTESKKRHVSESMQKTIDNVERYKPAGRGLEYSPPEPTQNVVPMQFIGGLDNQPIKSYGRYAAEKLERIAEYPGQARRALTPSRRERMEDIEGAYREAEKEGFKDLSATQLVPRGASQKYQVIQKVNQAKEMIKGDKTGWNLKAALGAESTEEKIKRIHRDNPIERDRILASYKKAKKDLETNKAMGKQDMGDVMTSKGIVGWFGNRKTEWDSLGVGGGIPQDKIEWDYERDSEGKIVMDKEGRPKKVAIYKKAEISIPVKTDKGWSMYTTSATPDNVRLAIDRRKQMQAETSKKVADTEFKEAETSNVRSLTEARARSVAVSEAKEQRELMRGLGTVQFGSRNFGREPIYLRSEEAGSVRDRYSMSVAPNVRMGILKNRQGFGKMTERALSNYSAPLTVNPLMRVGLPDVVGNRIPLDRRYVQTPYQTQQTYGSRTISRLGFEPISGSEAVSRLSLNRNENSDAIISRLSLNPNEDSSAVTRRLGFVPGSGSTIISRLSAFKKRS